MSSKSQRACLSRIFMTMILVAERRYSVGNPSDDSNSAHATPPLLFLMPRIFTWIPGQGDWARTRVGRPPNISTESHITQRVHVGNRICGSLTVGSSAD